MNSINETNFKFQIGKDTKASFYTLIGLGFMFLFKYLPAPQGLPQIGMDMIGILIGVLVLWITVSLGWPSLACLFALSTTGVMGYSEVIQASFGNWMVWFLVFCFVVSYSLTQTGFARRIALWFITRPISRKSPWLFISMFFLGILFLTSFLSGVTTIAIGLPIAEQILAELGYKKEDKEIFPQILILGVAFVACIGQGMTPIGHSTVLLGMSVLKEVTGLDINFAAYMAFGIPVGILTFISFVLYFKHLVKPDVSKLKNFDVSTIVGEEKKFSINEKIASLTYLVVILAWILPTILGSASPISKILSYMGTLGPIIVAVIFLSIIHIKGKPVLNLGEALQKGVGWQGLFLVSAVLALSKALTLKEVGLVFYLVSVVEPIVSNLPPILFILIITALSAILTNFISNNIVIAVMTNLGIVFAISLGINPVLIAVIVASISNYAFATPSATLQMAVAMGTGWIEMKNMFKYGLVTMAISIIYMLLVGIPITSLIY